MKQKQSEGEREVRMLAYSRKRERESGRECRREGEEEERETEKRGGEGEASEIERELTSSAFLTRARFSLSRALSRATFPFSLPPFLPHQLSPRALPFEWGGGALGERSTCSEVRVFSLRASPSPLLSMEPGWRHKSRADPSLPSSVRALPCDRPRENDSQIT